MGCPSAARASVHGAGLEEEGPPRGVEGPAGRAWHGERAFPGGPGAGETAEVCGPAGRTPRGPSRGVCADGSRRPGCEPRRGPASARADSSRGRDPPFWRAERRLRSQCFLLSNALPALRASQRRARARPFGGAPRPASGPSAPSSGCPGWSAAPRVRSAGPGGGLGAAAPPPRPQGPGEPRPVDFILRRPARAAGGWERLKKPLSVVPAHQAVLFLSDF